MHINVQTTCKYTAFERGTTCSADIHAHGQEAHGNLAVVVQSLLHHSLSHELLSAFRELLLTHTQPTGLPGLVSNTLVGLKYWRLPHISEGHGQP